MADAKQLYEERIVDLVTTAGFREPKHIPILAGILTWPFGYYHLDLNELLQKPQELAEKFCNILDEVYIDLAHISGVSTPVRTLQALGSDTFFISDDGSTIQHQERCFMKPEDYDSLIANPKDFMLNELGKRKLERLRAGDEESYQTLVNAAKEQMVFNQINPTIAKIMAEKYGVAPITGGTKVYPPFDYIFDRLRGFRGTMIDVRSNRAKLLEATNALQDYVKGWASNAGAAGWTFSAGGVENNGYPYAVSTLHCPTFMRPKDFEELYFPTFRELIEIVYNNGSKTVLFCEGSWKKFAHLMRELPKGSTICMIDEDDPVEMKKELGGYATICGGVKLGMLRSGTKEQCLDEAKRIVDGCAPGGGFIFCPDKSLCCGNDVNIENYAAVNDFVHNYTK
ncbi:MAG: hypothetical protein LUE24_08620 [Lachnospiraceae bacterium]|nr:hypothetical protein [Lachnospiraceae bacterium]